MICLGSGANRKHNSLNIAKEYSDKIEAMPGKYPPWVEGKLRGLMASLYVV